MLSPPGLVTAPSAGEPATARRHLSFAGGTTLEILARGQQLQITEWDAEGPSDRTSQWVMRHRTDALTLERTGPFHASSAFDEQHLLAAAEAVFTDHPALTSLTLAGSLPLPPRLLHTGTLTLEAGVTTLYRVSLWQDPGLWQPTSPEPHALRYALTQGRRHPRRPPKPTGLVYRRHIPWLGRTFSLRSIELERDLPTVHRWMNDPVVAHFWQEAGPLARHRDYLEGIAADPHAIGLVGCFDDEPFGYFEAYWAKEDRIAPFCDAQDHDRGWHVLVGEAQYRGRPWLTAWMPSIAHYLFLDDCRTQRIVIEPRADNHKMIKSLSLCGYALLKEFDFPHKRAMLGVLLRERFFSEALWIPHPS